MWCAVDIPTRYLSFVVLGDKVIGRQPGASITDIQVLSADRSDFDSLSSFYGIGHDIRQVVFLVVKFLAHVFIQVCQYFFRKNECADTDITWLRDVLYRRFF